MQHEGLETGDLQKDAGREREKRGIQTQRKEEEDFAV